MKVREIRVEGGVAFIPLTQGKEAVIDAADAHLVEGVNWCAVLYGNSFYAGRNVKRSDGTRRVLYMHRAILNAPEGTLVDHRDGDGLNCRRSNLRFATHKENIRNARRNVRNTSGVKGVSFNSRLGRWQAHIKVNRKSMYLGVFHKIEDAASAYAEASLKYHGDFGRTE